MNDNRPPRFSNGLLFLDDLPGSLCFECYIPLATNEEPDGRCHWCVNRIPLKDRPS